MICRYCNGTGRAKFRIPQRLKPVDFTDKQVVMHYSEELRPCPHCEAGKHIAEKEKD